MLVPTILVSGRLDAVIAEHAGKPGVIAMSEQPPAAARLVETGVRRTGSALLR
jgi:hypothetical protein